MQPSNRKKLSLALNVAFITFDRSAENAQVNPRVVFSFGVNEITSSLSATMPLAGRADFDSYVRRASRNAVASMCDW